MIWIDREPKEGKRLKSFSATSNSAGNTLKIELTIDDPDELAYLLRNLNALTAAQKAAAKAAARPAKKTIEQPELLALPAPLRMVTRND